MRKFSFTVSNRLPIAALSAAGSLMMGACALAATPPASVDMNWSTPSATPHGYAEYCARYEGQCLATPAEQARYVAASKVAAQGNFWSASFADGDLDGEIAGSQPAADAPQLQAAVDTQPAANFWGLAFQVQPASLAEPVGAARDQIDWASRFAAIDAKRGEESAFDEKPRAGAVVRTLAATDGSPLRVVLSKKTWALLSKTNVKINSTIARADDQANDGVPDRWNLPLLDGTKKGDCEDYALEKRRQLIEQGLPAEALSLAIVRTSWGETHAVLVVDTDRGAYVLDSLTPWVTPWTKAHFQWITRQAAGGGLWVRPDAASFQTAS
jgi:predicted transglutaminase-like cysteine proteinase